ncbi:hypothetical protein ACFOY8_14230 [Thalassospira xianhensis]|uniref:Uncharacterized protein n=1 Tax=Thalassospira xianhensis MCCC 1A02616 TaxID=1177929 RepID=A0A367UHA4_9PROT|nr:hypothetical protein [Thalassospira xianhensis]RCK07687.1 hypothetical protein TH5_01035 [Thalassospira xianhensis MCCC 1A02616]
MSDRQRGNFDEDFEILPSSVTGRVNSVNTIRRSNGDVVAIVSLRTEAKGGTSLQDVIVTDRGILGELNIDFSKPPYLPPHDKLVKFEVSSLGKGHLLATSMGVPEVLLSRETNVRVDGIGIIPAVARILARMSLASCVGQTRGLSGHSELCAQVAEKVTSSMRDYSRVRENKLGADAERHAMMNTLHDIKNGMERAIRIELAKNSLDERSLRQMQHVYDESQSLLTSLKEAVHEAHEDHNRVLSKSAAVKKLLPEFPAARRQAAAMVAWGAHQMVSNENTGGLHTDRLEKIKAHLAKSHQSDQEADRHIERALHLALRSLAVVERDVQQNKIMLDSIEVARANIATAIEWIGGEVPTFDSYEETRALVKRDAEAAVRKIVEEHAARDIDVQAVRNDEGAGIIAVHFANGDKLSVNKSGVIRMTDANDKLSLLQRPGETARHFVGGVPIGDKDAQEAFDKTHPVLSFG